MTTDYSDVPSNTIKYTRPRITSLGYGATQIITSDPVLVSDSPRFTPTITRKKPSITVTIHTGGSTIIWSGGPLPSATLGSSSPSQWSDNSTGVWNATTSALTNASTTELTTGVVTTTIGQYSGTIRFCEPSEVGVSTVYSTTYSKTITVFADPHNYTMPVFPPEETPAPCRDPKATFKLTITHCETTASAAQASCDVATSTLSPAAPPRESALEPFSKTKTTTLLVTAKQPTVVFSTISTANYGGVPTKQADDHQSAAPTGSGGGSGSADYGSGSGGDGRIPDVAVGRTSAEPPVTVAVQPSAVVIDGQTFIDNAAAPTQTVTLGDYVFTIGPAAVVGAGASVNRPGVGVFAQSPTSTQLGGLTVVVSASVAVIDGTTLALPSDTSTAVVRGQTVTFGPSGIAVASQTLTVHIVPVPLPTQEVVIGSGLLTAVGQSVLVVHGTTLTYGPASPATVTNIDGENVTIGSAGVVLHGTTLGGPNGHPGESTLELVGGATVTEIGASLAVVSGHTFTVGPGAIVITTVIDLQTFTFGPGGVVVETTTFHYPFGPTTTFTPGATAAAATAAQSSKNAGFSPRLDRVPSLFVTCIAIGVRVLFGILV